MQLAPHLKNIPIITLAALILVVVGVGIYLPLQPIGYPLYHWNMTYNAGNEAVTLPVNKAITPGISLMTLKTTFPALAGNTLVLPRISGNAIEVILNNETVYRLGDFNAPSVNLWNSQLIVVLPEPLRAENQLELRIASSVIGIGMSSVPYLASFPDAALRGVFLDAIFGILPMMTSGAAFIVGLMLLLSCYLRQNWKTAEFFIGIGLWFCVGFNYDMYFRASSGNPVQFLWLLKIIVICGYFASLSLICGLEIYIWKRLKVSRWAAVAVLCVSLVLLSAPDLYGFTQLNQIGSGLLFVIMTIFCLMIFKAPQKSSWLHLIAILTIIGLFQEAYELVFYTSMPIFLPFVISLSTITIGVNLILEFNRLFNENRLLRHASKLDPLTGALNRRVLKEIDNHVYRFAVLIDLNYFKELNDQHGHIMGDEILINFTNICRNNLRQDDLVVRWGGDEFLLVFANMPQNSSGYQIIESIIQRIKFQFAAAHCNLNLSFSYGITEIQSSFEQSLQEADRLMYAMKEAHKREAIEKEG